MSDLALSVKKPAALNGYRFVQSISVFIIALVVISPLFMLFIASLKDDRFQILADMGSFRAFWVDHPTFNNFREVGNFAGELAFGRYLGNSLFILASTVSLGLIINSMAGFILAWGSLPGRAIILAMRHREQPVG